jgi:phosphoribosyl 1,2-cyclic phosphodiesterase
MQLSVLGTATIGVPALFCRCKACAEALLEPGLCRTCCGAIVQGKGSLLLDASL